MFVTLVFFVLALVGFVFLVISMFFFGHDVEAGADADVHGGGPSFFSIRSMAVFLTSFGAIGAIANHYFPARNATALISSLLGVMGGVIMSSVYLLAMRMIYSQQASSLIEDRDLVGVEGRVTVAIPENGIGEIACAIGTQGARRLARARQAISEGAIVRVKEVHGDTVVVEPVA
ncbi:hypothetical protein HYR54_17780 [Candidatus Acetothermia bacterium]|nr:hypothetical protein [Candidatus Acetothermia bacterium]